MPAVGSSEEKTDITVSGSHNCSEAAVDCSAGGGVHSCIFITTCCLFSEDTKSS
jgi:hypothetical protein